jgi:UDP-glucuronate decarboxylase
MRHLVLGGAGFIGSHQCDALVRAHQEVICFDNLFTGSRANLDDAVEFVRGDVCEPFHFEVDRIWHLACPASPVHYQRNAVRTIKTAVMGTMHALECAREVGARLLIASTSEVYGDPDVSPQREEYHGRVNPVGVRSCYDEGKRCGEAMATSWAAQYGTEVRIARIFNTYGPRMASGDGRLIPNFITQALRGDPLTIYGDGSQTRSFCYIDDLVAGVGALMELPDARSDGVPIVNLGNPDERTILSVAEDVRRAVGSDVRLEFQPLPPDDPRQRCPDISRARRLLGWEPTVSYERGLAQTVAWFSDGSERNEGRGRSRRAMSR